MNVNDEGIEIRIQWSTDYWLIGQFLRWFIPRSSLFNSALEGMRYQPTDFFALQRHELFLRIIFVQLRAKVDDMNSWIVAFHNEKVLSSE